MLDTALTGLRRLGSGDRDRHVASEWNTELLGLFSNREVGVAWQVAFSLALLWLFTWASIRGLGVNKWMNNLGGFAAIVTALILLAVGVKVLWQHQNTALPSAAGWLPALSGWRRELSTR